jgi:peptide chain release factor subunit 1
MINERELQGLAEYDGSAPVVSFYIDTDLAHHPKDAAKLMFKQSAKALQGEKASPDLAAGVAAIERYLDFEYDWQARGVAVFASGDALWKTVALPVPMTTLGYVGDKPYVRGLYDLLDRFAEYAVALVDRESVRLFSVAWGRIQSQSEAMGEELKRHKQGGWAAARYQRHEDNLALHNLKQAVELIDAFCRRRGGGRLMLAGNPSVLAQVKELMPHALRGQVIGEFAADMEASPSEVLQRSLELAAEAQRAEEERLVSEAVTAASKGGAGAVGLDDTLFALREGRVRMLLVHDNLQASGYQCVNCGFLSVTKVARCPFCSSETIQPVPDMVNLAILLALKAGTDINIVRQNDILRQAGGMAALLRY